MFKDNDVVIFFACGIVSGPRYRDRTELQAKPDRQRLFSDLISYEFGASNEIEKRTAEQRSRYYVFSGITVMAGQL